MKILALFLLLNAFQTEAKISHKEAQTIFTRLEKLFKGDFKKIGLGIQFKIKKDVRINAEATSASFNANLRQVIIYSGYLNHSCQSYDSILATLCHEVGHHLARFNKNPTRGFRRFSVEGEADYWAAQVCLPRYYQNYPEDNPKTLGKENEIADINEICAGRDDYQICQKTLIASYNKIFCHYRLDRRFKYDSPPSFKTPDTFKVRWTAKYHPSPQCRLDSHLKGYMSEPRPRCWHRPKK